VTAAPFVFQGKEEVMYIWNVNLSIYFLSKLDLVGGKWVK